MKKRFLSAVLALTVLLTLVPAFGVTAFADTSVSYLSPAYVDGDVTKGVASRSNETCTSFRNVSGGGTAGDGVFNAGETGYASVTEALAAVTDSTETTVRMLGDSRENIGIAAGRSITLDLNGCVLQAAEPAESVIYIETDGALTLTDSNTCRRTHTFAVGSTTGLWTWDEANGAETVSAGCAAAGSTVTLTAVPEKGWTLETLTAKTAAGREIEMTAEEIGKTCTFTMPADVTVTATFMEDNTMLNFFTDVKASDYFYGSVLWAAVNGITSGTDATLFSPAMSCTRGEIVTFLYRDIVR